MYDRVLCDTRALVLFGFAMGMGQMEETIACTISYESPTSKVRRYLVFYSKDNDKVDGDEIS